MKWQGKPVFVGNDANSVNLSELRDPQADSDRASNPTYLIVIGMCTHLGCVPLPEAGDCGGRFCPRHGSHYGISGHVRKKPLKNLSTFTCGSDITLMASSNDKTKKGTYLSHRIRTMMITHLQLSDVFL